MDANMPSIHPSEQGAHASVFRFYAFDSIFMNVDYGLFKLEMRFNSSSPLFLLWIPYFPNWNEPIKAKGPNERNYQRTLSYSCCCNVVCVSP
jgi:hypothetical protein